MPSHKGKAWPLHGRDPSDTCWRDKRTNLILAKGAIQNWPTHSQNNDVNRERTIAIAIALEKEAKEKAARAKQEQESKKNGTNTTRWADC